MVTMQGFPHVPDALSQILTDVPSAAFAFSGGVDSSYLLYASKACGVRTRAYYVDSQFQPGFERIDAQNLAEQIGAQMSVIEIDVLSEPKVVANPANRCYLCKNAIFSRILARSRADGFSVLCDGSNASDDATDRPGMKALKEMGVRSPLRAAGLTKADVRSLSQAAGLFTWNKPSYSCLATRIPTNTALRAEDLQRVESAEATLHKLGFLDCRARVRGERTLLQFSQDKLADAQASHSQLALALSPWFQGVDIDPNPR